MHEGATGGAQIAEQAMRACGAVGSPMGIGASIAIKRLPATRSASPVAIARPLATARRIQITLRSLEIQPGPIVPSCLADTWRVRNDPQSIINELGELVDAAALDPEHWQALFQTIQKLVPGSRIAFEAYDEAVASPLPIIALGWDEGMLDAYARHYGAINPWVPSWFKIPSMATVRSDRHIGLNELQKTEFYNDWLQPIGESDFATGMKLVHERGRLAQFAVQYDAARQTAFMSPSA